MNLLAVALAALTACWLCSDAVHAEKMVISLSNSRVAITSNYIGENLVLFGAIEPDVPGEQLHRHYNVIATVAGPTQTYRTLRKQRVLGIWVNVESREFVDVPSFLAVLASRPFEDITSPHDLETMQIGLDNVRLSQRAGLRLSYAMPDDTFRLAFLSLQGNAGVYSEDQEGVKFLTPTVFRAEVALPSQVTTGSYAVDVRLFADGQKVAESATNLTVIKAGFEQYLAEAARDYGLLYGIATAMLALLTGWVASFVLRRD